MTLKQTAQSPSVETPSGMVLLTCSITQTSVSNANACKLLPINGFQDDIFQPSPFHLAISICCTFLSMVSASTLSQPFPEASFKPHVLSQWFSVTGLRILIFITCHTLSCTSVLTFICYPEKIQVQNTLHFTQRYLFGSLKPILLVISIFLLIHFNN